MPLLLRVQRLLCVAERVRGLLCAPVLVGGLLLRVVVRRRLCVALPHGGPHGQSRPHQCCLGEIHRRFRRFQHRPTRRRFRSSSRHWLDSTSAPNSRYEYMTGLMCYVCTVTVLNLLCQSRRSRQLVCSSLDFLCFPALPDGPSFRTDQVSRPTKFPGRATLRSSTILLHRGNCKFIYRNGRRMGWKCKCR